MSSTDIRASLMSAFANNAGIKRSYDEISLSESDCDETHCSFAEQKRACMSSAAPPNTPIATCVLGDEKLLTVNGI